MDHPTLHNGRDNRVPPKGKSERLSWLSSGHSGFCPGFSFTEHGVQDR